MTKARLLTLDEVINLKKGAEIWLEYGGCHNKLFMLTISRVRRWGFTFFQHLPVYFDRYGKIDDSLTGWGWRLWTERPTEEQMKAEAWEIIPCTATCSQTESDTLA